MTATTYTIILKAYLTTITTTITYIALASRELPPDDVRCNDELELDDDGGLVNTEERVQEAMQSLPHIASEVTVTHLPTDVQERDVVSAFLSAGCGCVKKCSKQFTTEHVTSVRASCTELSNSELDMAIFGQLMASVNTSSIVSTAAGHEEDERKVHFFVPSRKVGVCSNVFAFFIAWGSSD